MLVSSAENQIAGGGQSRRLAERHPAARSTTRWGSRFRRPSSAILASSWNFQRLATSSTSRYWKHPRGRRPRLVGQQQGQRRVRCILLSISLVHCGDCDRVKLWDEVDLVERAGGFDIRLRLDGVAVPAPVCPESGPDIQIVVNSDDPYRRPAVVAATLTFAADMDFLLAGDFAKSFWFPSGCHSSSPANSPSSASQALKRRTPLRYEAAVAPSAPRSSSRYAMNSSMFALVSSGLYRWCHTT